MNYRSINDLNFAIVRNLHRIPPEVELIVGIPRSGLLAANLLALHLNLPLADLEGFKAGRLLKSGMRMDGVEKGIQDIRNVVVLDDSVGSGKAMQRAKEELEELSLQKNIKFGAVYVRSELAGDVDFFFEECPYPRAFEWNMMHHVGVMRNACVEIDGVLARSPAKFEHANDQRYRELIRSSDPLLPCSQPIKAIVTARSPKYRAETEEWLSAHGIAYNKLLMADDSTPTATFKAKIYAADRANMIFVEDSIVESRKIAELSGKMVYSVEARQMIYPEGSLGRTRWFKNRAISFAGRMIPHEIKKEFKRCLNGSR